MVTLGQWSRANALIKHLIDQFRYIKIQPKTTDFSTRLMEITTEFEGFIPKSLELKSIVLGWILVYRNWSIWPKNDPSGTLF